jgi:hypothetical protein
MKKTIYFFAMTIGLASNVSAYAGGCDTQRVRSSVDNCGRVLTFTVNCTTPGRCSCEDLAEAAQDFIDDHTNSNGCYFL